MQIGKKLLKLPLIQGGMGIGVSLGNLAGHVAKCGAMGVISTANPGYYEEDFWKHPNESNIRCLQNEIKKAKEIACENGIVGINAMVATKFYDGLVNAAIEAGVDCIISGAGLPLDLPKLVENTNVAIAPVVSSGKAARTICKVWNKRYNRIPDFIVLEGSKAGGHLGFSVDELLNNQAKDLHVLLAEVLKAIVPFEQEHETTIPVFVAGGVYTSKDIKEFMDEGAAGAQIATRFIATYECDANERYKEVFVNSSKEDIQIVKSPVGMPGRAFTTPLIKKLEKGERVAPKRCVDCLIPCDAKTTPYCITNALIEAVKGNYEEGLFFCGSNGYKLDKIVPVRELIEELMKDIELS